MTKGIMKKVTTIVAKRLNTLEKELLMSLSAKLAMMSSALPAPSAPAAVARLSFRNAEQPAGAAATLVTVR
jgi:hypothetical protein